MFCLGTSLLIMFSSNVHAYDTGNNDHANDTDNSARASDKDSNACDNNMLGRCYCL
jgi:hypothetical protein